MKHVVSVALLLLVIGSVSCKKVYTCTCSDGANVKYERTLDKQKKKDAKAECQALSGTTVSGTTTVELKCSLTR